MNFWDSHTLFFCIGMYFFPRLTLIFATPWGGLLWWVGLIFLPRLMIALLATMYYGNTNPFLCGFVWLWAIRSDYLEQQRIKAFREGGFGSIQIYNYRSKPRQRSREGSVFSEGVVNRPPKSHKDVIEVDAEIIE